MPKGATQIAFLTFVRGHYWPTVAPTLAPTTRENAERVVEHLISTFAQEPLVTLTPERVGC